MKLTKGIFHFLATALFMLTACEMQAKITYVEVKNAQELSDGDTVVIAYKSSSTSFYNMYIKEENMGNLADMVEYNSNKVSYPSIEDAAAHCHKLRVVRQGTEILLFDIVTNMYLSSYDGSNNQYSAILWCKATADKGCFVESEKKGTTFYWTIGGRYLKYQDGIYRYVLRTKKDETGYKTPGIYKMVKTQDPVEITIDRVFVNDKFNTLMIPVAISNYKNVFGNGTLVYKIISSNEDEITVMPLEDTVSLQANTPYLITGTFNTPPYSLGFTKENIGSSATASFENLNFTGTYEQQTLVNADAYVLYEDVFYSCKNVPELIVSPFKWYITTDKNNSAFFLKRPQ